MSAVRIALAAGALVLAGAAPAGAATTRGFATTCAIDLASGLRIAPTGPVCGTDEGDDVGFAGEQGEVGFFGENGHDTVEGSRNDDSLQGGPGNDEIHGGRGADSIDGGDDADTLFGGLGDDVIRERRFGVRERLYGGPGADVVAGGRGGDSVYGGTGADVLLGGSGGDRLFGGPGDDVLYGGPNRDVFDCGPGADTVYRVRSSSSERSSTARRDAFVSRAAGCERVIDSDPTADFALTDRLGTSRPDAIAGGPGRELLQGKGGGDRLFGGGGDDELEGDGAVGQGPDLLMGGSGNDRLAGRAGHDRLFGDARSASAGPPGTDELAGGAGRDLAVGGPGGDLLLGAYDGDRILAGAGNDVISLLGGDLSDPNGRVFVDCGRGRDVVVVNPDRRGTFRNCESFAEQFHAADFGFLFRPSPETVPSGLTPRALAAARPRRSQSPAVPAPADPNGGTSAPSISASGGRVAFSSDASNLIVSDSNRERTDPFVRDLDAARTLIADATRRGGPSAQGGRLRRGPAGGISADGRYVVFSSDGPDLAGTVGNYAIFRRDLARGVTRRACRAGDDDSESPVVSAQGDHVVFESRATDLAGEDENQQTDVYRCHVPSGELRRVSQPLADGVDTSGTSLQPSVSADGRYVAFSSDAGGLVPGDGERAGVYWRDMQTGETRLVDVPAGAVTANGSGQNPKLSADGRFIAFDSDATDLPGGAANGAVVDVFRKDIADGSVALVSQGAGGAGAAGDSTADSISADGAIVGMTSSAPNLVAGDANSSADAFVRNLTAGTTARASLRPDGSELAGPSAAVALSADGRFAAFTSRAPAVTGAPTGSERAGVYRKDLAGGALVAAAPGLDLAPRSLIAEPSGASPRRKVRLIAGTARDDRGVDHVDVALSRSVGRGQCLWLRRNARLAKGPCARPVYLRARLVSGLRFTLRLGRLLPRGTYTVRSRAYDAAGSANAPLPGVNVTSFRLR